MKILYAVQATGNGHIARATELLPFLQKHGTVDIFLSGSNSTLNYNLPVQYTSKGLSLFYGNRGSLNYWKLIQHFAPLRILKEAKALPVEKYDIVINDFESITALACKMKKKSFVHFGHQASFASDKTPRPFKKDISGNTVVTKVHGEALKELAKEGGGKFYFSVFGGSHIKDLLKDIERLEKNSVNTSVSVLYDEKFQWPLFFTFLCFLIEFVNGNRRKKYGLWKGRFEMELQE